MCDFCENIIQKQGRNFELYEVAIVYDTEEKEYSIADDLGEYIGIKFCPMCGRKLSEETEKPRTKEVIEQIKEKMTEDDYMELKDNEKSFDDCFDGLLSILNDEKEPLPFDDEQDLEELILELEDQHMSDCITINRLNATIDILLDRYAKLREMRGV